MANALKREQSSPVSTTRYTITSLSDEIASTNRVSTSGRSTYR